MSKYINRFFMTVTVLISAAFTYASLNSANATELGAWFGHKTISLTNNGKTITDKVITQGLGALAGNKQVANGLKDICILETTTKGAKLGFANVVPGANGVIMNDNTETGASIVAIVDCTMAHDSVVHITVVTLGSNAKAIAEQAGPQILDGMF